MADIAENIFSLALSGSFPAPALTQGNQAESEGQ